MYLYEMEVVLGNLETDISQFKKLIYDCHNIYNRSSALSRNKKNISSLTITKNNTIQLTLTSEVKLKQPLKGLHLFSTLLIKNATDEEKENILYGKRTVLRLLSCTETEIKEG